LAPGATIKVTAIYSGSAIAVVSSATATYLVAKVATTFKVAVTPAVVLAKKPFTISVSGLRPQATGVVTFKVGGVVLCAAPLIGGAGKCTAKAQSKSGRITVSAVYPGDALHLAATIATSATVR
jgi:hypothetical protein